MIHWGTKRPGNWTLLAVLLLLLTGCETTPPAPAPEPEPEPVVLIPPPPPAPEPTPEPEPEPEPVKAKPVANPALLNAQTVLKRLGLYNGQLDGLYGPKSRKAILDYQYWNGLSLSGKLDEETRKSLEEQ